MEPQEIDAAWFAFGGRLADLAKQIQAEAEIPVTEKRSVDPKVIATTLLLRTTANFDGAMLLARAGLVIETMTLARSCCENLLWMIGLFQDGDSFVRAMQSDDVWAKTSLAKLVADQVPQATIARAREFLDQLKAAVPKPKRLEITSIKDNGLIDQIYVLYRNLSANGVHPSMTGLARHIGRDHEGFRSIDAMPILRTGELAGIVNYACIAFIGVCAAFGEMVGQTASTRALVPLADEYDRLKAATGVG